MIDNYDLPVHTAHYFKYVKPCNQFYNQVVVLNWHKFGQEIQLREHFTGQVTKVDTYHHNWEEHWFPVYAADIEYLKPVIVPKRFMWYSGLGLLLADEYHANGIEATLKVHVYLPKERVFEPYWARTLPLASLNYPSDTYLKKHKLSIIEALLKL